MKVLEISTGTAAACAGLLLAELGFCVDRLASQSRHPHTDDSDSRAHELFFNRAKQTVSQDEIEFENYDAIVEDCGEETLRGIGLSYAAMHQSNPTLAVVSLSHFGLSGPYSDWLATDLNAQAAGGVLHVAGYDEETPRKLPGDTAAMIAGVHGATAVISTVFGIQQGIETGVHVDISAQDTLMQHWTRHVADYAYSGTPLRRQPREPRGIHFRHTAKAKDGWIFMLALRQPWQDVAAFLGLSEFITPELMQPDAEQPWDEMADAFTDAVSRQSRYDWFEQAAELDWTFAPVEDPWAVANGPQTQARGSMHDVQLNDRTIKIPGLPFRFDSTNGQTDEQEPANE